ncbi:MAG: 6-phosphogluconolactonase [Propionibacteriaceae bacterium]|jgi:6-phosphogluconolactonase|nr:6-phosphogluconolactonase [Propionibacteriaceae bacterium]
MTLKRVFRFPSHTRLIRETTAWLLDALITYQASQGVASLGLASGQLSRAIYEEFARQAPHTELDPRRLHLWWTWDHFVAADSPRRNSLGTLSILASSLALEPANIHLLPPFSIDSDPETGAAQYAQELSEAAAIDVCLIELDADGGVAGLSPNNLHDAFFTTVAALAASPDDPDPIITMTPMGLRACRNCWILASGTGLAKTLEGADRRDMSLPVSSIAGESNVSWFVDDAAAELLPFYHCSL